MNYSEVSLKKFPSNWEDKCELLCQAKLREGLRLTCQIRHQTTKNIRETLMFFLCLFRQCHWSGIPKEYIFQQQRRT